MNVLHVIPELKLNTGGVAFALKNIISSLNKCNVDSTVLTSGESDINIDCEVINFASTNALLSPKSYNDWLDANITKFDLAHIHSIWLYHSRSTANICRKYKIPYILSPCGMLDDWSMQQKRLKKIIYFRLIEKSVISNAESIHCTLEAEAVSKVLSKIKVNKTIISLPVEELFFESTEFNRNYTQFLYLGRLHYKKQPDLVINAFKNLGLKNDWSLNLVGGGDDKYIQSLKDLCNNHSRIEFFSTVSGLDKLKFFRTAAFFVLPSLQENYGVAVAEAISSGTIPIISEEVALSKVVLGNNLGLVCKPTLESFRQQVEKALSMSLAEKKQLSERCISYGRENFSQSSLGTKYQKFYESVLKC